MEFTWTTITNEPCDYSINGYVHFNYALLIENYKSYQPITWTL